MVESQPSSTKPPLPIVFFGDQINGSGTISSLSAKGCTIQSSTPLQAGTHLTAQIIFPTNTDDILINEATVQWVEKGICKFEFTDISEQSQTKLQAILPTTTVDETCASSPYCPRCSSQDVKRTPRKGMVEHVLSVFFWYPFGCHSCGDRFQFWQWGVRYSKKTEER